MASRSMAEVIVVPASRAGRRARAAVMSAPARRGGRGRVSGRRRIYQGHGDVPKENAVKGSNRRALSS